MNFKSLFTLLFICVAALGFSQSQNIDKDIDKAIDELTKELESLDFAKIINEDLIAKIEEMKPSDKEINEMQEMVVKSLSAVKKIDFSAFEDMFKEFEKVFEDLDLPQSDQPAKKNPTPTKKGKKI